MMKPKSLKTLICAALAGSAFFCGGVANAAVVTDKFPILTYADHTVPTYEEPGGKRVGFISPNVSLVHIKNIRADGWAYGSYAIAGGKRVKRWFEMRELQGYANFKNYTLTIDADRIVYRTSAAAAKLGSVLLNAKAIVIGEEGNYLKIIYRVNGGNEWKMGWIEKELALMSNEETNEPELVEYTEPTGDMPATDNGNTYYYDYHTEYHNTEIHTAEEKIPPDGNTGDTPNIADNEIIDNPQPVEENLPPQQEDIPFISTPENTANVVTHYNPVGQVDNIYMKGNMLHIEGQAQDEDDPAQSVKLAIYVNKLKFDWMADESGHRFDARINLHGSGNAHIRVVALNTIGGGENVELGSWDVSSTHSAASSYAEWRAVTKPDRDSFPAYTESTGTNQPNGFECVYAGDIVDVLDEQNGRYLVKYYIGRPYMVRYRMQTKTRWVDKDAFYVYHVWSAKVKTEKPAFQRINGQYKRTNNEAVWVGDDIDVLGEDGGMIYVRYWSNMAGKYKDRWVEKSCLD